MGHWFNIIQLSNLKMTSKPCRKVIKQTKEQEWKYPMNHQSWIRNIPTLQKVIIISFMYSHAVSLFISWYTHACDTEMKPCVWQPNYNVFKPCLSSIKTCRRRNDDIFSLDPAHRPSIRAFVHIKMLGLHVALQVCSLCKTVRKTILFIGELRNKRAVMLLSSVGHYVPAAFSQQNVIQLKAPFPLSYKSQCGQSWAE